MKKIILYSILGLIAGILFSLYYDKNLNAFKCCFIQAVRESERWAEQLRSESDAPCYVFTAGSQVRLGCIHPGVMYKEFGVRAINAGGSAGYGLSSNTTVALSFLQPGDFLFVETNCLRYRKEELLSTSGVKYCFQVLGLDMFKSPYIGLNYETLKSVIMCEAGEISMFLTMLPLRLYALGRKQTNQPFRLHESGWGEMQVKRPLKMREPQLDLTKVHMNAEFREYLRILKDECKQRGVHLRFFMQASYVEDSAIPYQAMVALKLVEEGIPVLKDPTFGCESDLECFSDSINHMTLKGAKKYSRIFARSIVQNEYWTKEELEAILAQHGYAPDGTQQEAIK